MSRKMNIRPTTSVYATYKNLSYDPWTAIAEFVDNSTQSFYDNEKRLEESKYWKGLYVDIRYEQDPEKGMMLTIHDNAYGMNYRDFQRAIVLDSPSGKRNRGQFGMGLKTAACWFGTMWSVETTELGSGITYKTTVDVEHLHKYKNEDIEVEESECSKKEHGTTIRIWKMNHGIVKRQVTKTKDQLRGMYRTDLRTGKIHILYNDAELSFEDPEVLTELLPDGTTKVWKKEVSFKVSHNSRVYPVTGFIALRKKGSTSGAGLTLMRWGRVIIGGYENCYRPEEVFGQSNSYRYQRLFGELNLDDWPVTQTKDDFDWYDGLEEAFIEQLKVVCKEYGDYAEAYRVRTTSLVENVSKTLSVFAEAGVLEGKPQVADASPQTVGLALQEIDSVQDNQPAQTAKNDDSCSDDNEVPDGYAVDESINGSAVTVPIEGRQYTLNFLVRENDPEASWLSITAKDDTYVITFNPEHPFFKPFVDNKKVAEFLPSFAFAFALAEIRAKESAYDSRVSPERIRRDMDDSLKAIASLGVKHGR